MAGRSILPLPREVPEADRVFAERYAALDRYLAADELEYVTVWPLAGLGDIRSEIVLEKDLKIGLMSDYELSRALDTGVVPRRFPQSPILMPGEDAVGCLRHCRNLPKTIGPRASEEMLARSEAFEERAQEIRALFEQTLALTFPNPPAITGRLGFAPEKTFHAGGVICQQAPLSLTQRHRCVDIDRDTAASLTATWSQLSAPALLARQKAFALALRRLSYRASRDLAEDEMVDIMVAAEALYLSDLGTNELGFRLALRAAALSDPRELAMTRREVFDLMKAAYQVRSTIVHGNDPKPNHVQVRGQQVALGEFVQATVDIVRQGAREALTRAAGSNSAWPPDWGGLTLPQIGERAAQPGVIRGEDEDADEPPNGQANADD
jgi:Apea-like HEPN